MRYKHLLFDLDGTLFDYDAAEAEALKNTFLQFGLKYKSTYLKKYREVNKNLWQDFENGKISQKKLKTKRFDDLSQTLNLKFDSSEFSDKYLFNLSKGTELISGTENLLKELCGKTKLYLITNGLTIVQKPRIKNSTIGKYFADVIISEEVGFAKPQKEIFDLAFKMMGSPKKSDVLIIGDSLSSDITGGIQYGIDTCWFNPAGKEIEDNIHPKYIISELSEILEIIK
jgi:putative hydrolase of the HAD superfamily